MLTIRSNFLSAANRLELERCLRGHREEYGIARRANAVLLLDKGKPCAEIAEFLYLDDDTIRGWYMVFRQEGWDALAKNNSRKMERFSKSGLRQLSHHLSPEISGFGVREV
ncbi:helix-turn-helix domain containing protein [Amylibacter sp.]|nr:helix-turn-helix domain containing protein [Amylibacter sp.]